MVRQFEVRSRRGKPKLIPYVGCKSGFSHIFDSLIPDNYGEKIYDVFGGGGGFTFYACGRFGSENVMYNDHNPVITNLLCTLKSDPDGLYLEYQKHSSQSDETYYYKIRNLDLEDGLRGAGRFFYLAKNAFSGKIRFNSSNRFNSPMRKNSKCPRVKLDSLRELSKTIENLEITTVDYTKYAANKGGFMYLDPPYMNNPNAHYNAIVEQESFLSFLRKINGSNKVMISEHKMPETFDLDGYTIYQVKLLRSLQYFTQKVSDEIIAINYTLGN